MHKDYGDANADLCTTATQNDPAGHNPVMVCWDNLTGKRLVFKVKKGRVTSEQVSVKPFHILRPIKGTAASLLF